MGKRVTITKHDYELIEWLVKYFRENAVFQKFPAHQNLDELLDKLRVQNKTNDGGNYGDSD